MNKIDINDYLIDLDEEIINNCKYGSGNRSPRLKKKYKFMEEKIFSEFKKELQDIKNLTALGAKQALTMADASLLTGLSKSHLYKLVCAKKIPYYKGQGGKLTYFSKEELNKWLLQNRISTSAEIEAQAINYVVNRKKKV